MTGGSLLQTDHLFSWLEVESVPQSSKLIFKPLVGQAWMIRCVAAFDLEAVVHCSLASVVDVERLGLRS